MTLTYALLGFGCGSAIGLAAGATIAGWRQDRWAETVNADTDARIEKATTALVAADHAIANAQDREDRWRAAYNRERELRTRAEAALRADVTG